MRGDVLIHGLWESHTEAIVDVRPGDPYCDTPKNNQMGTLVVQWVK